jgi:hypothetical protein
MRLTGETEQSHTVVIWLTQRLLYRLVPHLCQWVQHHSPVAGPSAHPHPCPTIDLTSLNPLTP